MSQPSLLFRSGTVRPLPLSRPVSGRPALTTTERWQRLAPIVGLAAALALAGIPWSGLAAASPVYAAFCLGLGVLYLALLPGCERGGLITVALALANTAAALTLHDWPSALHGWLSVQTVIAALWLVRDQYRGERSLAGLLLGLNAGAVAALGFAL